MKNTDKAIFLVERFLDGETSIAQERWLHQYLISVRHKLPEMPEELRIAAVMLDELNGKCKPSVRQPRRWRPVFVSAAAVIALLFVSLGVVHIICMPDADIDAPDVASISADTSPNITHREADAISSDTLHSVHPSLAGGDIDRHSSDNLASSVSVKMEARASKGPSTSVVSDKGEKHPDACVSDIQSDRAQTQPSVSSRRVARTTPMTPVSDPYFITVNQNVANLEAEFQEYEANNNVIYLSL